MTENKDLKRWLRARMQATGASYTAVLAEHRQETGQPGLLSPPLSTAVASLEQTLMKYRIQLTSLDEPMTVEADEYDEQPDPVSGLITFFRRVEDRRVPVASVKIQDLTSIAATSG